MGRILERANVAKLVDALDLGSSGVTLGSSILPIRTKFPLRLWGIAWLHCCGWLQCFANLKKFPGYIAYFLIQVNVNPCPIQSMSEVTATCKCLLKQHPN